MATLELDLGGDFVAVLARAIANYAPARTLAEMGGDPCFRALASNRLQVRRWAVRRQRPGESWTILDTLAEIDNELARMESEGIIPGRDAEERALFRGGCGCRACYVCNPPVSCGCNGGSCSTPA